MAYIDGGAAYIAAMADHLVAQQAVHNAADSEQAEFIYRETLATLWQARIDRGELPPLTEARKSPQRASA